MVPQIDKKQAPMVTHAMNPAGQPNSPAHIGLSQLGAGMAAIAMHSFFPYLKGDGERAEYPFETGAKSACTSGFVKAPLGKLLYFGRATSYRAAPSPWGKAIS